MDVGGVLDLGGELAQQSGLADPRLALDEQRCRHALAHALEKTAHLGELGRTTDHLGARCGGRHGFIVPPPTDIRGAARPGAKDRVAHRAGDAVRSQTVAAVVARFELRLVTDRSSARKMRVSIRRTAPGGRGTIWSACSMSMRRRAAARFHLLLLVTGVLLGEKRVLEHGDLLGGVRYPYTPL